ncbi:MAG: carboxypeptidase [Chitinophagales bacterium]|nr:carboxypeptidase [Chitinophagales bacterium]
MKKVLKPILAILFCFLLTAGTFISIAQKQFFLPYDTSITTAHKVVINGMDVPYEATVGTLPVYVKHKDDKPEDSKKPRAYLQYTYYKRSDTKEMSKRPLMISFNGGPGTGSLWMHLGYTSPVNLKLDKEGFPFQPYGIVDNHNSVLDVADLLYVNPVRTGFSRMINDGKPEDFFGSKEDIAYLADWILLFVSREHRWLSPKFLIGESYGTGRVAGLAGQLANMESGMYVNGVILVSGSGGTNLDISVPRPVTQLPFFAATAWFHKKLTPDFQNKDITQFLPEVERFAINEYLPALVSGASISQSQKDAIAGKVAQYTGLSKQFVLDYNLGVPNNAFYKELLRDRGYTVSYLDSRYLGIDKADGGSQPDYFAELTSWEHSFTPAINYYLKDVLGLKTDLKYYVFGGVQPWNRDASFSTGALLRGAMAQNPSMHLLYQFGYYDSGWFGSKFGSWNFDPSGKMKDRIQTIGYKSGHMIYVRDTEKEKSLNDLRKFILNSIPKDGQPIKY